MREKYHWSDPAMTYVTPAANDPNKKFSMDAAGNIPPKLDVELADMKRPARKKDKSPEERLYDDPSGTE